MKYKLTVVFTFLLLASYCGYSQAILKAYIVKPDGDSVKGYVKLFGNKFEKNVRERLRSEVAFSESEDNFKKYKPQDLKEFGYYEKDSVFPKRYSSENVGKQQLLLYIEQEGPLRLYKDMYLLVIDKRTTTMFTFYYGKAGQPVIEVRDKYFDKLKSRGPLREYVSDCPLMEKELAEKGLDVWDLADKYNKWYQESHKG